MNAILQRRWLLGIIAVTHSALIVGHLLACGTP